MGWMMKEIDNALVVSTPEGEKHVGNASEN
jgi:hypothetical protein